MGKTMSPSTITTGQIGKIQDILGAGLRKSGIMSEPTQQVLETEGDALVKEFIGSLRKRAEKYSSMIVRHFKVDRTKTPRQMVAALGRNEYVNDDVLATMPNAGPEEGDLYFFQEKQNTPAAELAQKFESRGLVPDPYAQMQVNADDPSFTDNHPNGMQWQDNQENFCSATCGRWRGGERGVDVRRGDDGWRGSWWFAGRRKN